MILECIIHTVFNFYVQPQYCAFLSAKTKHFWDLRQTGSVKHIPFTVPEWNILLTSVFLSASQAMMEQVSCVSEPVIPILEPFNVTGWYETIPFTYTPIRNLNKFVIEVKKTQFNWKYHQLRKLVKFKFINYTNIYVIIRLYQKNNIF